MKHLNLVIIYFIFVANQLYGKEGIKELFTLEESEKYGYDLSYEQFLKSFADKKDVDLSDASKLAELELSRHVKDIKTYSLLRFEWIPLKVDGKHASYWKVWYRNQNQMVSVGSLIKILVTPKGVIPLRKMNARSQ